MADRSTPPRTSSAWDERTNPIRAWAALRDGASNDERRACLAAAIHHADRIWIALHDGRLGPRQPILPARDAAWHRLALSSYGLLADSGAYRHLAQHRPYACAAAEPVIAAWLNRPAAIDTDTSDVDRGSVAVTVAQHLRIDDAFTRINGDTEVDHLDTLMGAAQDARVFGVPGHRIELIRAARDHDGTSVVRLVVDAPHGPALASPPLHLDALLDPDSHGIGQATATLRRVADVVTDLFTRQAHAVWAAPPPMPVPNRADTPTGRAFPELRLDKQAAPPVSPTPTTAPPVRPRSGESDPNRTGRPR